MSGLSLALRVFLSRILFSLVCIILIGIIGWLLVPQHITIIIAVAVIGSGAILTLQTVFWHEQQWMDKRTVKAYIIWKYYVPLAISLNEVDRAYTKNYWPEQWFGLTSVIIERKSTPIKYWIPALDVTEAASIVSSINHEHILASPNKSRSLKANSK